MIQAFALASIRQAAQASGLSERQIMSVSASDNLTLPRPRLEYQILPARYRRTGRRLILTRGTRENPVQTLKRELYALDLDISVNVLAPDTKSDTEAAVAWLSAFTQRFIAALPRGGNDAAGNWVRISMQSARFMRAPDKRVGDTVIQVFARLGMVFVLSFQGRVSNREEQPLLVDVHITPIQNTRGV